MNEDFESNLQEEELDEENINLDPKELEGDVELNPTDFKANFKQTDLGFIAGKRGSGKSNLVLFIIDLLTKLGANILIIDPVLDIQNALTKLYGRKDPRIIHIPYQDRSKFSSFLKKLFKAKWKGILIIDEADGFFPNKKTLNPVEKFFIHIGRHYGVGGILVTRRMSNMATDIATQANKMMVFKHWHRADLDYLDQSGIQNIGVIRHLPKYHFQYEDIDGEVSATSKPVQKML